MAFSAIEIRYPDFFSFFNILKDAVVVFFEPRVLVGSSCVLLFAAATEP
jgi:hypothetical protein